MIVIINGTNNANNRTAIFCRQYQTFLTELTDEEVAYISMESLDNRFIHPDMFEHEKAYPQIEQIQDNLLIPAKKWVIITPEYNGSIPGIVKVFIDALSVRKYEQTFHGKQVALVGIATGRAGNIRGMDHMADIANFMGMTVFPDKLAISGVHLLVNEDRKIKDEETLQTLQKHAKAFADF